MITINGVEMDDGVDEPEMPFEGIIPPIAEKEKRGKRIKLPKNEIYVQELTTNASINFPPTNR